MPWMPLAKCPQPSATVLNLVARDFYALDAFGCRWLPLAKCPQPSANAIFTRWHTLAHGPQPVRNQSATVLNLVARDFYACGRLWSPCGRRVVAPPTEIRAIRGQPWATLGNRGQLGSTRFLRVWSLVVAVWSPCVVAPPTEIRAIFSIYAVGPTHVRRRKSPRERTARPKKLSSADNQSTPPTAIQRQREKKKKIDDPKQPS